MIRTFSRETYTRYLDELAARDERLQKILTRFGYPPFFSRPPGFAGLVRIILEQQVSLSSALSTWTRLEQRVGSLTPQAVHDLPKRTLEDLGITRQKRRYIRGLARTLLDPGSGLDMETLAALPDDEVRRCLTAVKGIGPWTADIYLIMGLHRMDLFPQGDLALNRAVAALDLVPKDTPSAGLHAALSAFSPYRSLLAFLLWHWYIQTSGKG